MSDESLTYRSSGVDVEANLEANRRIQAYTGRTYTDQVLTRGGLFGGALRLSGLPEPLEHLHLTGRMIVAEADSPEQVSRRIARSCRSRFASAAQPLAFLDYLAAARLDADRAADLVGLFSEAFAATPRIPIIGGETAEMPDVFAEGAWEVVGAIFAAGTTETGAERQVSLGTLRDLEQPALVFSMDGVGTKTKIGVAARRTSGLALDIIHHSLDDILCQAARGIGFMLYLGCHSRDEQLVEPVTAAAEQCCRSNGMALLDCLISEKPNLYRPGEIDVCGAIVGAVDADRLIQGEAIRPGDLLIGLTSSGLHTNGYSLARKALLERGRLTLDQHIDELGSTLGQALLEPHRNYAPLILSLLEEADSAAAIKGIAHITGGGLKDNLERILPGTVQAEIRIDSWQPPPIFQLIRRCGNIPLQDPVGKGMYESFNMGIGLVLVVASEQGERIRQRIRSAGQEAVMIGRVFDSADASPAGVAQVDGQNQRPAESTERVLLL
jgi:phosphoribosylformylglycinamidine cyclo-ligase